MFVMHVLGRRIDSLSDHLLELCTKTLRGQGQIWYFLQIKYFITKMSGLNVLCKEQSLLSDFRASGEF